MVENKGSEKNYKTLTPKKELDYIYKRFDVGLIYVDKRGVIIKMSPWLIGLLGLKKKEAIGKKFYYFKNILTKESLKMALQEFLKAPEKKRHVTRELEIKDNDGNKRTLEAKGSAIFEEKDFVGIIAMVADVTETKKAQDELKKEKEKAEKYLNVIGSMVLALDSSGVITMVNYKGAEILDYKKEKIVGMNWFENFIPKKHIAGVKEAFERIMSGEEKLVERYDNPIITKSGEEKMISWHNTALRNDQGKIIGTLSSGEDISEREVVEEAIQCTSRELEEKIRDLNKMNKFMAGREVKMVELKKKVRALEEKLKKES